VIDLYRLTGSASSKHVVGAAHQMRGGGRRYCRQDVHAHLLHHRLLPQRICTYSVRQLLSPDGGGRCAGEPGAVGHGRAGGLRSPQAPLLPSDRRVPDLLQRSFSLIFRKRHIKMVPRDQAPLSGRSDHFSGNQNGPAGRQGDAGTPLRQRAVCGEARVCVETVCEDPRRAVHGVQRAYAAGAQTGIRRSSEGSITARTCKKTQSEVRAYIMGRLLVAR